MRVDELKPLAIFEGLTDDQLAELVEGGAEVSIQPGVDLFREGEHADFWWVLVDGAVDLVRHLGREDVVVARMDAPGRWAGGFRAWDQDGVYLATGRGVVGGRVLRVPADVLRQRANEWFPFGAHLIAGLYRTARSIESTARQRESLITLGTLAAGLAHEINNPASAATRAVDALETAGQALVSSVERLRDDLSSAQFAALEALRREIDPQAANQDPLSRADAEQSLSSWLTRRGVAREWTIAPTFAAAGIDLAWCERAANVLDGPALQPGLEWVASTISVSTLLSELKESTRRISDLVAAVRSYSQVDRASMQRINLTDGLESTLVMLSHKLGDEITVVREYSAEVPTVEAYAAELNQVWTNLIDNAVDAMDGTGTLRVATRVEEGDNVVVEIGDSGPGMPPEVAARAFEAFYTTKDVGRGTGLGLDIARRIVVERHGGTITIDPQPGETVLRVRIPIRPQEPV
jgi:signal transduction histidine kinase